MSSFNQDEKWREAKQIVGNSNWLEVAVCYRELGGQNVFVYSTVNGSKRLIIDLLTEETVLLLDGDKLTTDTYANVLNSRKVFRYADHIQTHTYILGDTHYTIATETFE
jgi:hypothetical protein